MPDLKSLGAKITLARKAAGLSQLKLAKILGTAQCLIGEYERGERSMSVVRLTEIAEVLGVEAAELVE